MGVISVKITIHDKWVWYIDLEGIPVVKRGYTFHEEGEYVSQRGVYPS